MLVYYVHKLIKIFCISMKPFDLEKYLLSETDKSRDKSCTCNVSNLIQLKIPNENLYSL